MDHTWLQMGKAASRRWLGADSDSRDTCSRDKTGTSRSKDTCKKAKLLKSDEDMSGNSSPHLCPQQVSLPGTEVAAPHRHPFWIPC